MYIMRYILLILVIFTFGACEKDYSPTKPNDTGDITFVFAPTGKTEKSVSDSLDAVQKAAKPAAMTQLEVRVLQSDNELLASKTFTPSDGVFNVRMSVTAQENLKVLCLGMFDGAVGYFGIDDDVDVVAGQSTTAVISGWNDAYLTYIGDISPNPSTDGSYTVSWTQAPNATTYVLQEAANESFAGASTVYSGSALQHSVSGKQSGTYFYRVQASNIYNVSSSWSDIDSVTVQEMYTISGTVAGGSGATVILSGSASETQTADETGHFSFTVPKGGSYTVTPEKQDYTITPESITFENISDNQTANFTASYITFVISGTISDGGGATVTLSGEASETQTADETGYFSFTVPKGGTYSITPTKQDYTITPESMTVENVSSDQTANFTASYSPALTTYTISGTISGADNVIVTLSGDSSDSQEVNDGGSYSFEVDEGGNYTVTPSKTAYTFSPVNKAFKNVNSDYTQDFTASEIPPNTYTISGIISGADGVTVTLSGDKSQNMEINDGDSYSFIVDEGGNYSVTPTKDGYIFTPPSQTFSNISENQTRGFTATKNNTYFTLGSTMDEVRSVQGAPKSINNYSSYTIWSYGPYSLTTVKFSNDTNSVIAYDNYDNILNVFMGSAIEGSVFTIGSTQSEVLAAQGTPKSINNYSSYTIWGYGSYSLTTVKFSNDTNLVIEYSDYDNILNIGS